MPRSRADSGQVARRCPSFFIDRPIFAWVVAIFICLVGVIAIPLPAGGAISDCRAALDLDLDHLSRRLAENLYNSVTRLIEEELNGANGILNFDRPATRSAQVEINANFVPGTDTGLAVGRRAEPHQARRTAPAARRQQQGILIEEASTAMLQFVTLSSTDGTLDEIGLGDFMIRNVLARSAPHPRRRPRDALFAPSAPCGSGSIPTRCAATG